VIRFFAFDNDGAVNCQLAVFREILFYEVVHKK